MAIQRGEIPPHARLDKHRHRVINVGILLRGGLTVVAEDGTARTFRAGEGIVELVGTLHSVENRSGEPVDPVMLHPEARLRRSSNLS